MSRCVAVDDPSVLLLAPICGVYRLFRNFGIPRRDLCVTAIFLSSVVVYALIRWTSLRVSESAKIGVCLVCLICQGVFTSFSTELICDAWGEQVGALINVIVGNLPELMFILFATAHSSPQLVVPSLVGSITSNGILLLSLVLVAIAIKRTNRKSAEVDFEPKGAAVYSILQLSFGVLAILAAVAPSIASLSISTAVIIAWIAYSLSNIKFEVVKRWTCMCTESLADDTSTSSPHASWSKWCLAVSGIFFLSISAVTGYFTQDTLVSSLQMVLDLEGSRRTETVAVATTIGFVTNVAEHVSAILLAKEGYRQAALAIPLESAVNVLGLLLPLANILSHVKHQELILTRWYILSAILYTAGFPGVLAVIKRWQTLFYLMVTFSFSAFWVWFGLLWRL